MYFHAQNLNEKPGDRKGWLLKHGRCWLSFQNHRRVLECEWSFRWHAPLAKVGLATHDDTISISLGLLFCAVYFSVESHSWLRRFLERITKRSDSTYSNGREIGISCHGEYVCIDLWNDPMESRSKDPWWWHITIDWKELLFGKIVYRGGRKENHRVEIPLPEAAYRATVTIYEASWSRPLGFTKRLMRAEIVPDIPIPFPGKGENAWDCGEDATHSLTCNAATPLEAVTAMVKSVLEDRYRHGGMFWRPSPKTPIPATLGGRGAIAGR